MVWKTIFPDVACESVEHAVQELRALAESGHTLVVHMTSSSFGRPAETYCSEHHEHIVMELAFTAIKDEWGSYQSTRDVLLEALLDSEGLSKLRASKETLNYPGMNCETEEVVMIPTLIAGIRIEARRWRQVSNFNGGYDAGGTEFKILVN